MTEEQLSKIEIGRDQMVDEIGVGIYTRLVSKTGILGLSAFIEDVLDAHYPRDVFGDDTLDDPITMFGVNWAGERGGDDIEPGVKWVALLRHAVNQLPR